MPIDPQPPRLLRHPPAALPELLSVHSASEISSLHHLAAVRREPASGTAWRRLLHRGRHAAHRLLGDDRELTDALVRAVDALATRCDELHGQIRHLDGLLTEFVATSSEELVEVRAAMAGPARLPTELARPAAPDG